VGLLSCLLTVSAAEGAPFVGGHVGFGLGYVAGQDDGLEIPSDPTFAFSTKTEADGGLLSAECRARREWELGTNRTVKQLRDLQAARAATDAAGVLKEGK
jgi:hypothetical protein